MLAYGKIYQQFHYMPIISLGKKQNTIPYGFVYGWCLFWWVSIETEDPHSKK